MSNPTFIRGLFGEINGWRYDKIQADIERALRIDQDLEFITYTFGTENHKYLMSLGINSVLINPNPLVHKYVWRHKLDIYQAAMQDFDEIVYLDWDCNLVRPIPDNFWQSLRQKDPIQGCLYHWRKLRIKWNRPSDKGCIINNGFLYFGNKYIPQKLIDTYDSFPDRHQWRRNDETVTSFYIDKLHGWKGRDYWLKKHEPEYCYYTHGIFKKTNPVFIHYKTGMENGVYTVYG